MRFHPALLLAVFALLPVAARATPEEEPDEPTTLPAAASLPPVRVHLASVGSPTHVTIRTTGKLKVTDAATGEAIPGVEEPLTLSASGKLVKVGTGKATTVTIEAETLIPEIGRAPNTYPEKLIVTAAAGHLSLANECGLESYTQGVLAGECPALFHPEAIKAMAIAVRSYSYRRAYLSHNELCDTTHCQVYRGIGSVRSSIRAAVEATSGVCALYEGEVIDAVYCSDCGGCTEANEEAWKGAKPLPYLRPVEDAPEPNAKPYCAVNRSHSWSLTLPLSRLQTLLGRLAHEVRLDVLDLTQSGRVKKLELGVAPKKTESKPEEPKMGCGPQAASEPAPLLSPKLFTGEQWRKLFGLSEIKSLRFEAKITEKGLVIEGHGWGHGVGLCQFGAHGMGLQGASCADILKHYYTGVTLAPAPDPAALRARMAHGSTNP